MADFPNRAQRRAIEAWWARHPHVSHLVQAIMFTIISVGLVIVAIPITDAIMKHWPTWRAYYQYAGGWSLRLESPTGPPVTAGDGYQSQEHCEESRAWKMQQAYRNQRSIPSLSCTPSTTAGGECSTHGMPLWRHDFPRLHPMGNSFSATNHTEARKGLIGSELEAHMEHNANLPEIVCWWV